MSKLLNESKTESMTPKNQGKKPEDSDKDLWTEHNKVEGEPYIKAECSKQETAMPGIEPKNQYQRKGRINEYNKEYYNENKDKFKEIRKKKLKRNPNYDQEYYQEQKHKESYKKSHKKSNVKYDRKFPERKKARDIAQKIKIEGMCIRCNKNEAQHRHHEDYSKPLDVQLVCNKCHREIHNGR